MKKINTLIQTGDLKPKERVLLIYHNLINKGKTGKETLTENDMYALSEGWVPKNNREVEEYNRYREGCKIEAYMNLDIHNIYLNAQISLLMTKRIIDFVMWNYKHKEAYLNDKELRIDKDESIDLLLKNTGIEFNQLIYRYAFEGLDKNLKKDILILYPDAEIDSEYLDEEEIIAEFFNDKKYLTENEKNRLADLIIGKIYNKYLKRDKEEGFEMNQWYFGDYFADMPNLEIIKKWADYNDIKYNVNSEDIESELLEQIEKYSNQKKINVESLLRETIIRWLNEGLFLTDFTPIYNSDDKETCNNLDTSISHKEIFRKWLKEKEKSKLFINELIDKGELKVENRENYFLGVKEEVKIITGESIYNSNSDLSFVKDFKKQIEGIEYLGFLIIFSKNQRFLKDYFSLIRFTNVYKKLSIIYEIDLDYKINDYIDRLKNYIEELKEDIYYIKERLEELIYEKYNPIFFIDVFMEDIFNEFEEIEKERSETENYYINKFKDIFEEDFSDENK